MAQMPISSNVKRVLKCYFSHLNVFSIIIELSLSNLRIGALTLELLKFHKVRYLKRQYS